MNISMNGISNNGIGTVVIRENERSEQEKSSSEKSGTEKAAAAGNYSAVSKDGDTLTISKAGSKASAKNNDSESEEDTNDLSGYSQSELQSLLQSGTITRSEYNEEIKSRED